MVGQGDVDQGVVGGRGVETVRPEREPRQVPPDERRSRYGVGGQSRLLSGDVETDRPRGPRQRRQHRRPLSAPGVEDALARVDGGEQARQQVRRARVR